MGMVINNIFGWGGIFLVGISIFNYISIFKHNTISKQKKDTFKQNMDICNQNKDVFKRKYGYFVKKIRIFASKIRILLNKIRTLKQNMDFF